LSKSIGVERLYLPNETILGGRANVWIYVAVSNIELNIMEYLLVARSADAPTIFVCPGRRLLSICWRRV